MIELVRIDTCALQAEGDRMVEKAGVVFMPRKTLLLGCGHDNAVLDQRGRRIVIAE
jgi:hypothetical protein